MKKRLLSVLLSLAMVITMMPAMASLSFAGEANTTVPVELVKATTSGSRAVKLSWNKVSGATKYVVYGQKCGKKYKKLTTTSKASYKVKKIKKTKLKAHKTYKFYVVAYKGSKKLVTSKSIHFITGKTMGKYANAKSIKVSSTSVTLEPGKTAKLKATTKIYKNKKHIKTSHGAATRYVSDNPTVASVNANGVVTANKEGIATIYVQDIGGLWCTTTVKVEKAEPPAPTLFTVTFNMQEHGTQIDPINDVVSGSTISEPTPAPAEDGYEFGGWYKEAACTTAWNFDNDVVTADTTLYAKWTQNPTPPPAPISVTSVSLNITELGLTVGDEDGKLSATVLPENATDKSVTWTSSDESVATVDSDGNVRAVAAGDATITVTTVDGGKTATCTVTVTASAPETKKLSEILPSGFPTSADSAWVTTDDKKAYKDGDNIKVGNLTLGKDTTVTKSGDNYVCKSGDATVTFNVKDGAAESITVTGQTDSNGTYVPAGTTFKAVYDITNDANTLTFYYDNKDHSGDNITVYDSLPTAATQPTSWGYNSICGNIKSVVINSSVAGYDGLTSTAYMFQGMKNAGNISGTENLDTSKVTNMTGMFFNCNALSSLDVSGFDTSNVTNMQSMFNNCYELSLLDFSNFKTSNVTNMQSMFLSCKKLTALDISSFNTSEVGNMNSMFKDCSALETITFGNSFYTSNVTDMGDMFLNCTKLQSLGLSSFNTSKVTKMTDMFQNCKTLTTLDLSSFNTSNVTTMKNMFNGCEGLTEIGLDGFTVGNETAADDMFKDCSKLTSVKINAANDKIKTALGEGWTYNGGTKAYEKQMPN